MRCTPWLVSKKQLMSQHGLVVCQNDKAARAGAAVLADGGNAVDAAVATAVTLSVVEPWLSGLGGGGFMVVMDGRGGQAKALDFGICAPKALNPADYPLREGDDGDWFRWPKVQDDRNIHGYGSIGVPGATAGLAEALRTLGTLPWARVLEPAIAEAKAGLELDWFAALALAMDAANLARYPESAVFWLPEGRAPRVSDTAHPNRLPLPATVSMLERLAQAGPGDMYTGELARLLIKDLRKGACPLTLEDLTAYRPLWVKPLSLTYRGWDVHAMPGLSAGPSLIRALQELEHRLAPPAAGSRPGPDHALLYSRICREVYEDRLRSMGHAGTGPEQRDPSCANNLSAPEQRDPSCTSNLCVIDAQGTVVTLTNTLLSRFGSKVTSPALGMLLNNGIMWFDPRPGHPNSLKAGARPLSNMSPVVVSRDGLPRYGFGAAGGRTIFPTLFQIMSYVFDFGMSLEEAFLEPRVDASTGVIRISSAAGKATADKVGEAFPVEVVEDSVFPVRFSLPSAVARDTQTGLNTGMAHHNTPWATTAEGAPQKEAPEKGAPA